MPDKVVDASVLAALSYEEPRSQEAGDLLVGSVLHAPNLLAYELTNVARKKLIQDPTRRDVIIQALEDALSMDLHLEEVDHIATLELALSTGLSTYDASYLQLSRSLDAPLVTFDEKLQAVIRGRTR